MPEDAVAKGVPVPLAAPAGWLAPTAPAAPVGVGAGIRPTEVVAMGATPAPLGAGAAVCVMKVTCGTVTAWVMTEDETVCV